MCRAGYKVVLPLLVFCFSPFVQSQTTAPNEWTWMGGLSTTAAPAVYGTLGTPAPGNTPPVRYGASTWTDHSGNFWLFGGAIGEVRLFAGALEKNTLNDLWEFNPATNEWTWMGGTSSPTRPGEAGIYGTQGVAAATNYPSSRDEAVSWTDSQGNFWLFGGAGVDANGTPGALNDLWEFNPSTKQWTWISGSTAFGSNCFTYDLGGPGESNCAFAGVYGTLGTPASGNTPASRLDATTWIDSQGNLWLFGGWGYDVPNSVVYYYNDLWEFSTSTKQWTWMGGTNTGAGSACFSSTDLYYLSCGEPGMYGTLDAPNSTNAPGGRSGASGWTDNQGNLWLFGGQGFSSNGFSDLNDLWKYSPSTNQWTWVGGSNVLYDYYATSTGVFGTVGVPAAGNLPPTRFGAASWKDSQGNFWLLGGGEMGWYGNSGLNLLEDLWQFNPSTSQWTWMGGEYTTLNQEDGVYGTLGTPAPGNNPGDRLFASSWTDNKGNFWFFGGALPIGYVPIDSVSDNDLWGYQPANGPLPTTATPTFSVPAGTYSGPLAVRLSDATNGATIYYTTDGSTPTSVTTPTSSSQQFYPGNSISIPYSKTLKAIAIASGCNNSDVATAVYTLPPLAATPTFSPGSGTYTTFQTLTISDTTPGASIYYTTDGLTPTTRSSLYTGPVTLKNSATVQAIAVASGYSNSLVAVGVYNLNMPTVATPVFSPPYGTYNTPQTVTISDATPGATILYKIGGYYPDTSTFLPYTGPITVSSSEPIWAFATATNYYPSEAGASYTIDPNAPQAATPTFSLPSGTYTTLQTVAISDTTPTALIHYTTDGSTPGSGSLIATSPITISSPETIKAIAIANGYVSSPVASATYTVNLPQATAPTFSVASGTYTSVQTLTLSDATTGASIYYTTDGTIPTTNSMYYSAPVNVSSTETVKAIASANGYANSPVVSASYTINLPQDFSVSASSAALSINAGQNTTSSISVTPINGFSSPVSFACSGLPAGVSCNFTPATVTPSGGVASTTLTLAMAPTIALLHQRLGTLFSGSALALACCLFGWRKRLPMRVLLLIVGTVAGLGLLNGCGSSPASRGPGTTSANFVVTAASGTVQHSMTFSVTVSQ